MKVLLLPIDDRPVTYGFPQMLCRLAGVQPLVPPRNLLGALNRPAASEDLAAWMEASVSGTSVDAALLCLDSYIYGGLINSRRGPETSSMLSNRLGRLKPWRQLLGAERMILAQSSIMRISDNYDATEEKAYWARYGREIFAWSGYLHRLSRGERLTAGVLSSAEARVPLDVRQDYLSTRRRNFQVNRQLLQHLIAGHLDTLFLSLDDSGEVGLNVLEKERLLAEAKELGLADKVFGFAGADEVLCALIARWLIRCSQQPPRASLAFNSASVGLCPSRYEGQSIESTVEAQLQACGIAKATVNPDFQVIVHGHSQGQGDHIWLSGQPDLRELNTRQDVELTLKLLESAPGPVVLCDVAYANGADPLLLEALIERQDILGKLWGYAGWNTTGNSVGSALAMGVACWWAQKGRQFPGFSEILSKCLFTRLADDWAYQARVRRSLDAESDAAVLTERMQPYLAKIAQALSHPPGWMKLSFPWERTFEIEIGMQ